MGNQRPSTAVEFIFLPSTGLNVRSIKFPDRFFAVAADYSISNPAFVVGAVSRIIAKSRICCCDAQGLWNGGAVNQRSLEQKLQRASEYKESEPVGKHCRRLHSCRSPSQGLPHSYSTAG